MAFDGITVAALVAEIDDNLKGGRINKIAQPENDELLITGKGNETRQKYGSEYLDCPSDVEYTKKYLAEYDASHQA